MANQSITLNYSATGYTPLGVTTTANVTESLSPDIANNTANLQFSCVTFANTALQSIYAYCTGGNLTIKTNNTTTPSASNQTFTFVANHPLSWESNSPIPCPFTGNVSNGIFVTNTSGNTATLFWTHNTN